MQRQVLNWDWRVEEKHALLSDAEIAFLYPYPNPTLPSPFLVSYHCYHTHGPCYCRIRKRKLHPFRHPQGVSYSRVVSVLFFVFLHTIKPEFLGNQKHFQEILEIRWKLLHLSSGRVRYQWMSENRNGHLSIGAHMCCISQLNDKF